MGRIQAAGERAEGRQDKLALRRDEAAARDQPAAMMDAKLRVEMAGKLAARLAGARFMAQDEAIHLGLVDHRAAAGIGEARIVIADDPGPARRRAAVVVDEEARVRVIDVDGADQHDRQRAADAFLQEPAVHVGRHHEQTIDATDQRLQCRAGLHSVAMRAGNQQVQAAGARRDVDAANQLGEEFPIQGRQHDADRMGAAGHETLRAAIRDVLQAGCSLQHAGTDAFGDGAGSVQSPRNRCHGDMSFPGHIFQCCTHASAWSACSRLPLCRAALEQQPGPILRRGRRRCQTDSGPGLRAVISCTSRACALASSR